MYRGENKAEKFSEKGKIGRERRQRETVKREYLQQQGNESHSAPPDLTCPCKHWPWVGI